MTYFVKLTHAGTVRDGKTLVEPYGILLNVKTILTVYELKLGDSQHGYRESGCVIKREDGTEVQVLESLAEVWEALVGPEEEEEEASGLLDAGALEAFVEERMRQERGSS